MNFANIDVDAELTRLKRERLVREGQNGHASAHVDKQSEAERLRPRDLEEFLALPIKPREMVLDPIIPEKGLAMLYAPRGVGKTHVALGIVYAAASAGRFLKWTAPKARRVLLIDGEMPAATLQERLACIVASAPEVQLSPNNIKILAADLLEIGGIGNLGSSEIQAELDQWLEGVDLLVLDNLSSLTAVLRDNDAESWTEKDTKGEPRDPWVAQWFLPLTAVATGDIVTFVTGSKGGVAAVSNLCRVYGRRHGDGLLPIVALRIHSYKHKQYGRIETPDLPIVGWEGAPTVMPAQAAADDLNDTIPF